jgi:hypothetical protein
MKWQANGVKGENEDNCAKLLPTLQVLKFGFNDADC